MTKMERLIEAEKEPIGNYLKGKAAEIRTERKEKGKKRAVERMKEGWDRQKTEEEERGDGQIERRSGEKGAQAHRREESAAEQGSSQTAV